MAVIDTLLDRVGRRIAGRLEIPCRGYAPFTPSDPATLRRTLRPADVLLVEGNQKLATAIIYMTQSTWSHAALYVGDAHGHAPDGAEARTPMPVMAATPRTCYQPYFRLYYWI